MIKWTEEIKKKAAAYYGVHGKTGIAEHLGLDTTDEKVRIRLTALKALPKAGKIVYPHTHNISDELREEMKARRKKFHGKIREGAQKFWQSEEGIARRKQMVEQLISWRYVKSEEEVAAWNKRKSEAQRKYWDSGSKEAEEGRERQRKLAYKRWAREGERERQSKVLREYQKTGVRKKDRLKKERGKDENNTGGPHP